jgi:hypothetical protein
MINLILFCFGTAGLTLFLDMCMEKEMILHWYYRAIEKLPLWLFKPLGGCPYCFGTWVYVFSIILVYVSKSESIQPSQFCYFTLLAFLGIGFNYVFIKVISRI